jgi:rhodanese-related sulfurtransferase
LSYDAPDETIRVALQLMQQGYTKVYALKGGWNQWVEAKCPTEKK